jgi:glycosyltransferase involved in cell wall biosynthesis
VSRFRTVLVVHWGRLGAGPRITGRLSEAFSRLPGVRVIASVNRHADSIPDLPRGQVVQVDTYLTRLQLVLRLPLLLVLALRTRRLIRRRHVDLYFSPMLSIWQSLAVPLIVPHGVTVATTIHDATEHPGDRHPLLALCRRLEIARADVVVAFSEHSAAALRPQVGGKPVVWVPHGTDPDPGVRARQEPGGRPVIGFFGRISEYKGVREYAEAVRLIRAVHPEARGLVLGDGEVDPALVAASSDDIDWRVGWIPEPEVERRIDELDLVLLPYQEASQSGVLALAASRGIPAIATPIGGLVEQAAETGNCVLAADTSAAAVADAALELLADPERYRALSERGLAAAADRTSWGRVAERLLNEIDAATDGQRPRGARSSMRARRKPTIR